MTGNVKQFLNQSKKSKGNYMVVERLDQSLPLITDEWTRVEQLVMQLTEFAPNRLVAELVNAVAIYADDQARRGYILGQDDFIAELKKRVA